MLVQFSVENFKSFRDLTTFSMRATNDGRHPGHVVSNLDGVGGKSTGVLRGAAIYGANAAGKSNLVLAIEFARRLITEGVSPNGRISTSPYRLDTSFGNRPSRFEFIFRHQEILYSYGFAADSRQVHEEWLFATERKHESVAV